MDFSAEISSDDASLFSSELSEQHPAHGQALAGSLAAAVLEL